MLFNMLQDTRGPDSIHKAVGVAFANDSIVLVDSQIIVFQRFSIANIRGREQLAINGAIFLHRFLRTAPALLHRSHCPA